MKHRHKIKIKQFLKSESIKDIILVSDLIIDYLKFISCSMDNVVSGEQWGLELENLSKGFELVLDLAEGTIPPDEWASYNFYGNFRQLFNSYMEELYYLAKQTIEENDGVKYKFILVE